MKKRHLLFFVFVFIVFIFISIIYLLNPPGIPRVCIKENCFEVEIALTPEEKAKGLMFREFLDEDKGMFFIYEREGLYNFWMKNTLIPLDIIWIDSEKKIVYIEHEAQPCGEICESLSPSKNARYVLEINSGITGKLNIVIGDSVEFYNIKLNFPSSAF